MAIESLSDITKGGTSAFAGGGGSGDVVGPASSVDDQMALFSGTTGKLLKAGKKLTVSTTAPVSPTVGDIWVDSGSSGAGAEDDLFFSNAQTVTQNHTTAAGRNEMTIGPITIADGVTVTVTDGTVWTVV